MSGVASINEVSFIGCRHIYLRNFNVTEEAAIWRFQSSIMDLLLFIFRLNGMLRVTAFFPAFIDTAIIISLSS